MRINIVKSKNAEQLYIIKSYRKDDGCSTTRIVEKLGSVATLLPKHNNDRDAVIAWAKEKARILTEQEKNETLKVPVMFSEAVRTIKGERHLFNAGYLFPRSVFHQLGLNEICKSVAAGHRVDYDLSDILEKLICARIIAPSSKLSSFEFSKCFLQQPNFDVHQIYRALSLLAAHSDDIQAAVYRNSQKMINRNKGVLYYDCTNYFFEIEEERGNARYGKSKEHRPNPIVQMGLFMDRDGIPLSFAMFPGNANEQPSLKPLERKILKDFGLSKFVVCTDAGLASSANRQFNDQQGRSFIVTQSLKKMKDYLREWALDPTGWKLPDTSKKYDLTEVDEEKHMQSIFYKERWIEEGDFGQRMIVTFSFKYLEYQRSIRQKQIERAVKIINNGGQTKTKNQNSPTRLIDETAMTADGELAKNKKLSLNQERIDEEERFDGFYAVCTTLTDRVTDIIAINKERWQIEAAFRTLKSEFKARPVYLQRDDRIEAHFLTCFLSLLIILITRKKLAVEYPTGQLIDTLRHMSVHKLNGIGYLSSYERSDITDALHEAFGFRTDSEFISDKTMKKILKKTTNH